MVCKEGVAAVPIWCETLFCRTRLSRPRLKSSYLSFSACLVPPRRGCLAGLITVRLRMLSGYRRSFLQLAMQGLGRNGGGTTRDAKRAAKMALKGISSGGGGIDRGKEERKRGRGGGRGAGRQGRVAFNGMEEGFKRSYGDAAVAEKSRGRGEEDFGAQEQDWQPNVAPRSRTSSSTLSQVG